MKWYEGGIAEAVTLSRKNCSIFVVYIEGSDDKSTQLTGIVESNAVSEVLGSNTFVAIKLEANSLPHQQFSEIYKQTSIPSIYFIGKSGTPLEIITDVKDANDVLETINTVVVKNGGAPLKFKSETLIKTEAAHDVVSEGDVCRTVTEPGPSQPEIQQETPKEIDIPATNDESELDQDGEGSLTTEEKLKLAQDLIEKKRAQKKIDDDETERNKELERRKLGQDVLKMKRWQQEQEMKQIMEERQREKREEQEARDKVKRQIEEDKKEKAARLAAVNQHQQVQAEQSKKVSPSPINAHTARLQFRLPNGTSHMHDFPSSSVLQEVTDYIKQNMAIGFTNFILSTTFPRREFSEDDANRTLLDLQLVPNAVILILPAPHGAVVTNTNAGVMGMVWYVLTPIFNMLGYLRELIFGRPTPTPAAETKNSKESTESAQGSSRPVQRKRGGGESVIKRHGNVHRLTDRDSDDDNNTWNGNSTQQM